MPSSQDDMELLRAAGLQSAILVPLVRRNKVLGLLALGDITEPRNLHARTVSFGTKFSRTSSRSY